MTTPTQPLLQPATPVDDSQAAQTNIEGVSNADVQPLSLFAPIPAVSSETLDAAKNMLSGISSANLRASKVRTAIKENNLEELRALLAAEPSLALQKANVPYVDHKANLRLLKKGCDLFDYALLKVSKSDILLSILTSKH